MAASSTSMFSAMSVTIEILGVGVPEREVTRAAELGRRLARKWESHSAGSSLTANSAA